MVISSITYKMPIDKIQAVAENFKKGSKPGEYWAKDPTCSDSTPSVHITEKSDGTVIIKAHNGTTTEAVVKGWGMEMRDLFPPRSRDKPFEDRPRTLATYDYKNADGKLVFQVVRQQPADRGKTFKTRRPDGAGGWIWNLQGVEPLPYRLPELLQTLCTGKMVLAVEGEKDVDNLTKLGFTATCNHGGAGKWREEHSKYFPSGAKVTIIPDNDGPGKKHGEEVNKQLQARGCETRIIDLPGLPEHGDVSDWLDTGHTKEELLKLIVSAWDKPQEPEPERTKGTVNSPAKQPVITCLKDVQEEEVQWLWERYIAFKKLCIVEGDPSHGKTWFVLFLVSAVSRGWKLPDPETGAFSKTHEHEPANVIYMTAEDGLSDTVKPRLTMLGANHDNVYIIEGQQRDGDENIEPVSMQDLGILRQAMERIRPTLLVFDPLQGYLGPNIDMNQANKTRPVLTGILRLAEEFNCAVVIIRHLNKQSAGKASYRGMGSIDFTAAARTVLLIGKDPGNEQRRVIVPTKCNISFEGVTVAFELDKENGFSWLGKAELTAEELLYPESKDGGQDREQNRFDEAIDFLQDILANGKKPIKEVKAEAKAADIKEITLRRAKENINVVTFKNGADWFWTLPDGQDEPYVKSMSKVIEMPQRPINKGFNHVDHKKRMIKDDQDDSKPGSADDSAMLFNLIIESTPGNDHTPLDEGGHD